MDSRLDLVPVLVGFGRELRREGLRVGSGQVVTYCQAVGRLDPGDPEDVYWAGRASLVSHLEDVPLYDRAFRRYFEGAAGEVRASGDPRTPRRDRLAAGPPVDLGSTRRMDDEPPAGTRASTVEVLRRKRFEDLTPEELAALRRLMARVRMTPPHRRSRRTAPARRGPRPDLRRTIRRALRQQGEVLRHSWRRPQLRPRRIVLILDVSGSMAGYSRALLQFAYSAASRSAKVEVFCFGTRLTRITDELRHRDPDDALDRAAGAVADWQGGTRIGESIGAFVRGWGRRGLARGAVVVICSDGLDRGDPATLPAEMARLRRLAHRVVWVNPLKGDPRYEPLARGMRAALPHVDLFVSGHDLASLESLASLLPALG